MRRISILAAIVLVLVTSMLTAGRSSGFTTEEATPEGAAPQCPSPLATPEASPAATPAPSPMPSPTEEPICVAARMGEFYINVETTTFRVGQPYVFAVGNEGAEVHEFVIEPGGSQVEAALETEEPGEEREAEIEDIAPDQVGELEWTFTEPGRYQFACHLPGHFEAGMVLEFEVIA